MKHILYIPGTAVHIIILVTGLANGSVINITRLTVGECPGVLTGRLDAKCPPFGLPNDELAATDDLDAASALRWYLASTELSRSTLRASAMERFNFAEDIIQIIAQ